jgi:hypothetical protein
MGKVVVGLLVLGALAYGGFWIVEHSWETAIDVQSAPPQFDREEEILRGFFTDDLAQKKIAHLYSSDLADFETVAQPRPDLTVIRYRVGDPDSVAEMDLSAFGAPRKGRVHYYGRLGLVTPAELETEQVFWIYIRPTRR